jgi:hypothetical protein
MTETKKVTALDRLRRDETKFAAAAVRRRRMNFNAGGVIALLALVTIFVAFFSLFTVPQTSQALIVRLGDPVGTISEPGLHMKMPFVDTVIYVDNRILDLESGAEEVIASDQKRPRCRGLRAVSNPESAALLSVRRYHRRRQFPFVAVAEFGAAARAQHGAADAAGAISLSIAARR